jgi:RNA polymerase sigma factor (sigma-70 family)
MYHRRTRVLMTEHMSDAALLDRFVSRREEAAFVELVQRHGPNVIKVCRRFLRNEHDVEDVFQATFLVLALKAAGISWNESMGGWLHAVARRLALNAREGASRHRTRERPIAALAGGLAKGNMEFLPDEFHPLTDPLAEIERRDLRRALDEALHQLPEKYRAPVILCYLEGKTNKEAARLLGWPAGSMSRRLERARSLLRQRLAHITLMIGLGLLFATLALLRIWSAAPGNSRTVVSVRQAMRSLQTTSERGVDFQSLLERIARDSEIPPDREQVEVLARKVQWVADWIAEHDPGGDRELWQFHTAKMRLAALDLAQAARIDDRAALLGAARNLDVTCVRCHEVFHPETNLSLHGRSVRFHNPL